MCHDCMGPDTEWRCVFKFFISHSCIYLFLWEETWEQMTKGMKYWLYAAELEHYNLQFIWLNLQVSCIVQLMSYKSVCMNLSLVSRGGRLFCIRWWSLDHWRNSLFFLIVVKKYSNALMLIIVSSEHTPHRMYITGRSL